MIRSIDIKAVIEKSVILDDGATGIFKIYAIIVV